MGLFARDFDLKLDEVRAVRRRGLSNDNEIIEQCEVLVESSAMVVQGSARYVDRT